jgi:hypothetical protein
VHKCAEILEAFFSRGQSHKRYKSHKSHVRKTILSLICDHDILHVRDKELVAINSVGSIQTEAKIKAKAAKYPLFYAAAAALNLENKKSFQFFAKDGTTCVSTKFDRFFLISSIQILVDNFLEDINTFNIKVATDKCFGSSFSLIKANMTKKSTVVLLSLLLNTSKMDLYYCKPTGVTITLTNFSRGQSHEHFTTHISVTVDPSSNLSLSCDHNKELVFTFSFSSVMNYTSTSLVIICHIQE